MFCRAVGEVKYRKRRRSECSRTNNPTSKTPMNLPLFVSLLLAVYVAVVQGEARTLRHYRTRQHTNTGLIDSRSNRRRSLIRSNSQGHEIVHHGIGEHSYKFFGQELDNVDAMENVVSSRTTNKIAAFNTNNIEAESMGIHSHKSDLNETTTGMKTLTINTPEEKDVAYDHTNGSESGEGSWNGKNHVHGSYSSGFFTQSSPSVSDEIHAKKIIEPPDLNALEDSSACVDSAHECCGTSDCLSSGDVCVNRNCIDNGDFRFTLQWIGDDDYDLFVITPDGKEISYNNFFDPVSLGNFGETTSPEVSGHHIENVYFPANGGPNGVYQFFVRPFLTVGESDDWIVTVVEAGKLLKTESGAGASESFFCRKEPPSPTASPVKHVPTKSPVETVPSIAPAAYPNRPPLGQEPTTGPKAVSPVVLVKSQSLAPQSNDCSLISGDECCSSSDCKSPGDVCQQRICIKSGSPRFTLTWTGEDNLDLFVITPDDVKISETNQNDPKTGGRYERNMNNQDDSKRYMENIYFTNNDQTSGTYEYGVRSRDGSQTTWVVEVYDGQQKLDTNNGSGDSETFTYFLKSNGERLERPDQHPPRCSPTENECCIDEDCSDSSGDLCVQRSCINDGSLRITLEWIGDDDLNLIVQTSEDVIISEASAFDAVSGGRHERSKETAFGYKVENVYFPATGTLSGALTVYVDSVSTGGVGTDLWTLKFCENGVLKSEETGFGESVVFSYEVTSGEKSSSVPPLVSNSIFPREGNNECNIDSGCKYENQVCVADVCVREGSPRFTLQWPGEGMYKLNVVTPGGKHISAFSPFDPDSDGSYEGPTQLRKSGTDVENVYFPTDGGPQGLYTYFVTNSGGIAVDENWNLTVSVDGEVVANRIGSGKSNMFSFRYSTSYMNQDGNQTLAREFEDDDCSAGTLCPDKTICMKDTCIDQGNPQFVLTWSGDSELFLSVFTPVATTISRINPLDSESGGKWRKFEGMDTTKSHIETVFFEPQQGPFGEYAFQVQSPDGMSDDWTLSVFNKGEKIASHSGRGTSITFTHDYSRATDHSPTHEPNTDVSIPLSSKCTSNIKCLPDEICSYNVCLKKGSPQFLLSWEGDYDVAISVVTPKEDIISWQHPVDLESGGKFEQYVDVQKNLRLENIYFPSGKNPHGIYPYYVHSFVEDRVRTFSTENVNESWTLTILIDGNIISKQTGQGSSEEVLFFSYNGIDSIPKPENPEDETCDPSSLLDGQCCSNAGCFPNEACTGHNCVDEGNPRFTLSWEGENDLDLLVVTPSGTVISYSNVEDIESGGKFGEAFDQFEYGFHAENVYFPTDGGPIGEYGIYVRSFLSGDTDDVWTVGVFVNGKEQASFSGTGSSERLAYNLFPLFSYES